MLKSGEKPGFLGPGEDEFRQHESDRQHYFEEGEERRDAEARQRSENHLALGDLRRTM